MKNLVLIVLALIMINTKEAKANCKVVVTRAILVENANQAIVEEILSHHGFEITTDVRQANLTAIAEVEDFGFTSCGDNECVTRTRKLAAVQLFKGGIDSYDYFTLSAFGDVPEPVLQSYTTVNLFRSSQKAMASTLKKFDQDLESITCK